MTFDDYQDWTHTTALYKEQVSRYVEMLGIPEDQKRQELYDLLCFLYTTLGLVGEAGEIANKTKKVIRDSAGRVTDEMREDLRGEYGDVGYYMAQGLANLGSSFDVVMQNNRRKLKSRLERGKIVGKGDKR